MRFETLGDQGVVEGSSDFLEKEGGARHEVGDGVAQLLYGVVRIICDEDQRVFSLVCFVSVCDLRNSDALCGGQLHIVEVREGRFKTVHACHAVFHGIAVCFQESEWCAGTEKKAVHRLTLQSDAVGGCADRGCGFFHREQFGNRESWICAFHDGERSDDD